VTAGEAIASVGSSFTPSRSSNRRSPAPSTTGTRCSTSSSSRPVPEVLPDGGCAAGNLDIVAAGGLPCLLKRGLDAVADEYDVEGVGRVAAVSAWLGQQPAPGCGRWHSRSWRWCAQRGPAAGLAGRDRAGGVGSEPSGAGIAGPERAAGATVTARRPRPGGHAGLCLAIRSGWRGPGSRRCGRRWPAAPRRWGSVPSETGPLSRSWAR
jgi:hypothetical protein